MTKKYISSFQGLRWILIFIIFVFHCGNERLQVSFIGSWGSFGVCAFIVLSGFLYQMKYDQCKINGGGVLIEKKSLLKECASNFWKSAKKCYPLHWLTLIIDIILFGGGFAAEPIKATFTLIVNALLLQSWFPGSISASFNTVSWYLCVTMFTVTISPIIVRAIDRLRGKWCWILLFGIIAVQFLLALSDSQWICYKLPPVRTLDFCAGAILYLIGKKQNIKWKGCLYIWIFCIGWSIAIGVAVCSLYFDLPIFMTAAWSLPVWLIIFSVGMGDKRSKFFDILLANPISKSLGGVTHEFFMIHLMVIVYIFNTAKSLGWLPLVSFALSLAISLFASYLLYWAQWLIRYLWDRRKRTERTS